jgi:hypothetical protein
VTQPDQLFPDDAANKDSFAAFAGKTQAEYEADQRGAEENRWGLNLLGALFEGLEDAGSFIQSLLTTLAKHLLNLPEQAWNSVEDVLESLKGVLQPIIDTLMRGFTGDNESGNSLQDLALAMINPMSWVNLLLDILADVLGPWFSRLVGLEKRVNNIELSLAPGDETGFFDNCSSSAGFVEVVGDWQASSGVLSATTVSVGNHVKSPATDRHGAGIKVRNKRPGVCGVHICADDAVTNYVRLSLRTGGFGDDYARISVGHDPRNTVAKTQTNLYVPDGSYWELRYDPDLNSFLVYKNGDEIEDLRWEDVDNEVTHGSGKRRVGPMLNGDNNFLFRGFDITDFNGYDWTESVTA